MPVAIPPALDAGVAAPVVDLKGAAGFYAALRATGSEAGEALRQVIRTHGVSASVPVLAEGLPEVEDEHVAVALLRILARKAPELAQGALLDWGRNRTCGSLDLSRASWVRELPEGLKVGGALFVHGCTELRGLPAGLAAQDLYAGGCVRLTTIAAGLKVRTLRVEGCRNLEALPDGLEVEHLNICGCPKLVLPSDLKVRYGMAVDPSSPLFGMRKRDLAKRYPGIQGRIKLGLQPPEFE
jgi:hypothetical protein